MSSTIVIEADDQSPMLRAFVGSDDRRMTQRGYRRCYVAVGVAMGAAVAAGAVVWLVAPEDHAFPLVFWIEVVLLMLYTVFWVLQTVEHWEDGIAPEAVRPAVRSHA